ncbi:MAG: hypothetical protein R3250_03335 [Melioribacteraceae bacterium]|nr:hypothetical protein [Melioribacteraceae bacterium]
MGKTENQTFNQLKTLNENENISYLCEDWLKMVNSLNEPVPKKIGKLMEYIISQSDSHGVLLKTVEELSKAAKVPLSQTRKGLLLLHSANIIIRKHGIIMIRDSHKVPKYN